MTSEVAGMYTLVSRQYISPGLDKLSTLSLQGAAEDEDAEHKDAEQRTKELKNYVEEARKNIRAKINQVRRDFDI
jgi:hypothetical protein